MFLKSSTSHQEKKSLDFQIPLWVASLKVEKSSIIPDLKTGKCSGIPERDDFQSLVFLIPL